MRRWHALILLATLLLISSAYALPWKIPARWRVIYEINTDPITENNMVVIELNIPESIYDWVYYYADKGAFCEMAKGNADIRWLYPVIYYVSTYNQEQREPYSLFVAEAYEHTIQGCVDEWGNPISLRLPKIVRVTIQNLDGGDDFKNYQHYIYIYQPQGFMRAQEWGTGGDLYLNIPLDNINYIYVRNGGGHFVFRTKSGDEIDRGINRVDESEGWTNVLTAMATDIPFRDYETFVKVYSVGGWGYYVLIG